ncbi:MAG: hypothetical protein GWM90_22570, partial [Gemmatimonadetes bacterium]|nr:hypothetical protein [Gemmatimonadota bacterium]NIQ57417.1 hypothetical protein [Gemmatimonadota bacterium]NIU77583.1 hypothetical protein [Gammaproteobacteria bacterium]NIX46765.1 hypothetical protein [Gemmatimonadota bacterium]NIY11119.1 hypothetical protein [Gemmatimonadota bacterium]
MKSTKLASLVAVTTLTVGASGQIPRVDVRWEPDYPVQGRLFRVIVDADRSDHLDTLRAEFAGEPLHFHEVDPGQFMALAAAPIDVRGELLMPVAAV